MCKVKGRRDVDKKSDVTLKSIACWGAVSAKGSRSSGVGVVSSLCLLTVMERVFVEITH